MHILFVLAAFFHSHKSETRFERANPSKPSTELATEKKIRPQALK